jgi:hypothetical protein
MERGKAYWSGAVSFLDRLFPARMFIASEHIPLGKQVPKKRIKRPDQVSKVREARPAMEEQKPKARGVPPAEGIPIATHEGRIRVPVQEILQTVDRNLYVHRGKETISLLKIEDFHELGMLNPVDTEKSYLLEPDLDVKNLGDPVNYNLLARSLARLGFYGIGRWLTRGYEASHVAVLVHPDTLGRHLEPKLVALRLYTDAELLSPDKINVPSLAIPSADIATILNEIRRTATRKEDDSRPHLQAGALGRLLRRLERKQLMQVR